MVCSYNSQSTRTVIKNGQRLTIQSMEKGRSKTEERYVANKLVEREISRLKENVGQIRATETKHQWWDDGRKGGGRRAQWKATVVHACSVSLCQSGLVKAQA